MLNKLLVRNEVLIAGHHGFGNYYPENTLLAFKEALDAQVDMLILDVQSLKDATVVIRHELVAGVTTDGTGTFCDMTVKQVKMLDAGIRFGKQFEGLQVPTLNEVCSLINGYQDLILTLEVRDNKRETVDLCVNILRMFGMLERCIFSCLDADVLFYVQEEHGLPIQSFLEEKMVHFKRGPAGTYANSLAVAIDSRRLNRALVRDFENRGILPWGFGLDTEEEVEKALRCGARMLVCNDPRTALKIVTKWRLHPHMLQGPLDSAWEKIV